MSDEQIRKNNEPKDQVDDIVELRVAEALQKDVGRGIARIDPGDMAKMGVKPGDIVGITGKKESVTKVMPSFPKDRGKNNVQIDGLVRDNVDANLGEKLHLKRIKWKLAVKLELLPIGAQRVVASGLHNRHVGRLLEGWLLLKGIASARHQSVRAVGISLFRGWFQKEP